MFRAKEEHSSPADESETQVTMHYRLMPAFSPRMRTLDGPSVWQDYADGDTACLAASALCDRYMEYAINTGFLADVHAKGCAVALAIDDSGALQVSDDVGSTVSE